MSPKIVAELHDSALLKMVAKKVLAYLPFLCSIASAYSQRYDGKLQLAKPWIFGALLSICSSEPVKVNIVQHILITLKKTLNKDLKERHKKSSLSWLFLNLWFTIERIIARVSELAWKRSVVAFSVCTT